MVAIGLVMSVAMIVVMAGGPHSSVLAATTTTVGECSSSSDCGPSSCCLVGYMRYSIPQCSPLGDIGSWCRRQHHQPSDLHYPNGIKVTLTDSYSGMCPCRHGLVCSRMTSTCQLPKATFFSDSNSLDEHDD